MVALSEIKESNSSLKSVGSGLVAVVVGATNGIGRGFLKQLVINTDSPKVYYVGRKQSVLDEIQNELKSLNPSGEYLPVLADDLVLLKNVDKATEQIKAKEKKIDLLFMSQGYVTFAGRDETEEGIDKITSIRYYGRMRFVYNLLNELNAAPSPRVISILGGGLEGKIYPDDMSLKDPKIYGVASAADVAATYNTLFLEALHEKYPKISFVHMFPGLVKTNLFKTEHFGPVASFLLNWIIAPLLGPFLFHTPEEAGQRTLYAATNGRFRALGEGSPSAEGTLIAEGSNGQVGSGVYTLNDKVDAVHNDKILKPYRESGMVQKIWDHTMQEFDRATAA